MGEKSKGKANAAGDPLQAEPPSSGREARLATDAGPGTFWTMREILEAALTFAAAEGWLDDTLLVRDLAELRKDGGFSARRAKLVCTELTNEIARLSTAGVAAPALIARLEAMVDVLGNIQYPKQVWIDLDCLVRERICTGAAVSSEYDIGSATMATSGATRIAAFYMAYTGML